MDDLSQMPPTTNHALLEYRVSQQEKDLAQMKEHIAKLESHVVETEAKRTAQEKRQLVAGIMFLGSVIVSLSGVVWTYRTVIFRGE